MRNGTLIKPRPVSALLVLAIIGLAALALLQSSPWVVQTPGNDSGIFLYFGAQILKGKLPFVDLWDHKPPLVFYLDALGLLFGSRWGVWAVEVASLSAASLFAFGFLRRSFRAWPALLGVAGMLFNLAFTLEGGNLTEEYALAFQMGALYLFATEAQTDRAGWKSYAIGALMGCAFLLKQTLIGVWVAMGVYLVCAALFTHRPRVWLILIKIAAGFAAPLLLSGAFFALRGGLAAYWDVAFWYNFVYSSVAQTERISSLLDVLGFLNTRSGFFMMAVAAWFAGIGFIILHHEATLWHTTRRWVGLVVLAGALVFLYRGLFVKALQLYAFTAMSLYRWGLILVGLTLLSAGAVFLSGWMERRAYPWLKRHQVECDSLAVLPVALAVIDLPVELLMVSVSGRGYLHYYLSLYPPLAILIAFLAWSLPGVARKKVDHAMHWVWSAVLLIPVLFGGVSMTIEKIHPGADSQTSQTVSYIRANTRETDTILMWGTQTGIYYLSGRDAPTRYVHQIPLFNPRYATPERVGEFLAELQAKKPALIIDTRLAAIPLPYQSGDPATCASIDHPVPSGMEQVYRWVCENYEPVETIGKDSWLIYRYNPAVHTSPK